MIDVTFLGQLVGTLASFVAFLALLGVVGAAAYVLSTAAVALERLPTSGAVGTRGQTGLSWTLGTIAGALSFVVALATLQVGSGFTTLLFSLALAACARSSVVLVGVLGARTGARFANARLTRQKLQGDARARKQAELDAAMQKRLLAEDLSTEVAKADASLGKLRAALTALVNTRESLAEKLKAALDSGGNVSLVADMVRMRDDMDARIELGTRVLRAAEVAVARLAFALPVKKLVRRRPSEVAGLEPHGPGNYAARIESAIAAIDKYHGFIVEARAEIDKVATERGSLTIADGTEDPAARARKEVDAVESAYRSVRERAEIVRLGLRAKEGMANVATAAGEISVRAGEIVVDEREAGLLLDDLARANQTTTDDFIGGDEHVKALAKALARGAKALSGGDRASLGEVVEALQSMQ